LLSLLEILLDQDSSDYFPTFPGPRQRVKVSEYQVVLSPFFFQLNVSFEYFRVFLFDFVVVLRNFLRHRHCVFEVIIILNKFKKYPNKIGEVFLLGAFG
jgi:hypothetical protein